MDTFVEVHPIEVRGTSYPVTVDEAGRWHTIVGSERITGDTRAELQDKLRELSAKAAVRVEIPFVLMTAGGGIRREGDGTARGIVTGIHAGNGNMLVDWKTGWQAGQKTQWTPSYSDVIFEGDISADDVRHWRQLKRELQEATRELSDFEQPRKIQLRDRVVVAIKEAVERDSEA